MSLVLGEVKVMGSVSTLVHMETVAVYPTNCVVTHCVS